MPANAAIYIQRDDVDLATVFDAVKSDKGLFKKRSYFDVMLGSDLVRFNIMEQSKLAVHIAGFLRYIAGLDQDEQRKQDAREVISHTRVVLGLSTSREFDDNDAIWHSLFQIAAAYDGFVFVRDSLLLPNGAVLVGPLLDHK
jgi:hypothetical protein